MPTNLLKIWAWIKLNAVMLSIAAAILVVAVGFSYMKGRGDGRAICQATVERQNAERHAEVIKRIEQNTAENAALRKKFEAENAATNTEIKEVVKTVYKTLEKVVEVPVEVEGPCRIDYDGVARVFDNAASAYDHRSP